MKYKTYGCIRRTQIWAGKIKKKLVICKILSKLYSLYSIYEVWFLLNNPWLQLNEK